MKIHFKKTIIVLISLFLTGCYRCNFDWNCSSESIAKTGSYKRSVECRKSQQDIARSILGDKYNQKVDSDILNKCIDSSRYKFESDPEYITK